MTADQAARPRACAGSWALAACAAATMAGCSALWAYPNPEAEDTEARCTDGQDNDFDGTQDCADSGCRPFCPETGPTACRDGLDNDSDGRFDCSDFDCEKWCTRAVVLPNGASVHATEVTRGQYDAWLATAPPAGGPSDACSWNTTFDPSESCMTSACQGAQCQNHPQVCVDWCDAAAYCTAVGKELCGRPEGGPSPAGLPVDETRSEWFDACSSGGTRRYPYGPDFVTGACNGADSARGQTIEVGSFPICQAAGEGYLGVFDLVGNAAEWTQACSGDANAAVWCTVRGGGFRSDRPECALEEVLSPSDARDDIGFRCCAPIAVKDESSRATCSDGLDNDLDGGTDCADEDCKEFCCGATGLPLMVRLPPGACIDSTEVTRKQYKAWLDTGPTLDGQPFFCAWNDDFTPTCGWPPGLLGSHPVACVDWCDAHAYCQGVGKRLCGAAAGGAVPYDKFADPAWSTWFNACSSGGWHAFPYGDAYDSQACNGQKALNAAMGCTGCYTMPAASMPGCQSSDPSYAGIFDLSGNVWEWEDCCEASTGRTDSCRQRGGAFRSPYDETTLACGTDYYGASRDMQANHIGFRCCSR